MSAIMAAVKLQCVSGMAEERPHAAHNLEGMTARTLAVSGVVDAARAGGPHTRSGKSTVLALRRDSTSSPWQCSASGVQAPLTLPYVWSIVTHLLYVCAWHAAWISVLVRAGHTPYQVHGRLAFYSRCAPESTAAQVGNGRWKFEH